MRKHHAAIAAGALISVAALTAPGYAQTGNNGPLVLAKSSYFFVNGKIDPNVEGSAPVNQIYVEYMIPQRRTHKTPIIMVHGGSQTGTNFTGTPDGREGWAQYFVRKGYAVYVIDGVARGRSADWSDTQGPKSKASLERLTQRFVAPERYKLWPQAHLHTQWPGEGKPGDAAFDQFYFSQFPSIVNFTKQQEINPPAIVALLDKIGPSILLTHSQSGSFIWPVVDARPNLVKANRRRRAQRAAGARVELQGRARLVRGRAARQGLRPGGGADRLRSAGVRYVEARIRAAGQA